MRRRELLFLLASAMTPAHALRAQQMAMPVIGYLSSQSAEALAPILPAFRDGLKEAGYIEGRNFSFEFAWAAGQYDKLPALAEDLVRRQVSVIVASGGAIAALAAKAATSTIPIVFAIGDDPVQYGLVGSFKHPGGNITGITLFMATLTPKRLEFFERGGACGDACYPHQSPQSECRKRSEERTGSSTANRPGIAHADCKQ